MNDVPPALTSTSARASTAGAAELVRRRRTRRKPPKRGWAELQRLMDAAGLSDAELALKIGVTERAILSWRLGEKFGETRNKLKRLAAALDTTIGELFGESPAGNPPGAGATADKKI